MTLDYAIFNLLILLAMAVTGLAPIILVALLAKDWKKGELW